MDQNEMFKKKKTRCRWPQSKHNVMKDGKPYSRAIDIFEIDPDKPTIGIFSHDFYKKVAYFLKDDPITWSGTWSMEREQFAESCHFQLAESVE